MKHQYNTSLNLVVAFLLYSIVDGCTSLEPTIPDEPHFVECASLESMIPNEPYSGPYPSTFNELADKNPLLAQELAKLPELQDGISEDEARALENLVKLYDAYPDKFDNSFEKMYEIGIPKARKYCSPLQALFWMAEEGKNKEITRLISNYSLKSLLKQAWGDFSDQYIPYYKNKYLDISQEQAKQIVASVNYSEQKIYAVIDPRSIKKVILTRYDKCPEYFPKEQRKIIQDSIRVSEKNLKWNDPEIIMERLNAPELLDFYIDRNISWKLIIDGFHRSPDDVINEKWGDCDDLAYFGRTILKKAGYCVFGRLLGNIWKCCQSHIGLGIKLEDGSYLLAVDFRKDSLNHMSGPYKTLFELDKALGFYDYRALQRTDWVWQWRY